MMAAFIFNVVLVAFLLAVATWVITSRAAFSAVVAFVAYGLMLAIVWVELSAIDIALTEAAIGGGVTGMLLLGAANRANDRKLVPRSCSGFFCWRSGPR